jgi:hypothetical protein
MFNTVLLNFGFSNNVKKFGKFVHLMCRFKVEVGKKGNRGEKIQRDLVGLSGKFDHVR